MKHDSLSVYLNDHSAGAAAAISIIEHLETQYAGTDVSSFAVWLRSEVEADERQLQSILTRLDISGGYIRKAGAWLTERVTQLKLLIDDPSGGSLRLLELLEVLTIGIEGKRMLWHSLRTVAPAMEILQDVDFEGLIQRAHDQRERLEPHRLVAAYAALVEEPVR